MKNRKHKLILILLSIVVVFLFGIGYYNYTDDFQYFYTQNPVEDDLYIEMIFCAGDNMITKSKLFETEMKKFTQENRKISEVPKRYFEGEYKKPIYIQAYIEIRNGKTIYTYSGYVTTKDNKKERYYHSFSINCIPTFEIPDVFK